MASTGEIAVTLTRMQDSSYIRELQRNERTFSPTANSSEPIMQPQPLMDQYTVINSTRDKNFLQSYPSIPNRIS